MRARQPANSPPPKIVVPKERIAPAPPVGLAPETKSRTPPCTIKTASVIRQPMQNHHKNDRTKPHGLMAENGAAPCPAACSNSSRALPRCQAICILSLRSSRPELDSTITPSHERSAPGPSVRDAETPIRSRLHCLPSPDPVLRHCRRRRDNSPRRTGRTSFDSFAAGS